jgi:glutathione S-transferase
MVREKLDALGLAYRTVEVSPLHAFRAEVIALSGQSYVPVIQDGDLVIDDEVKILAYLEERYGEVRSER